MTTVAFPSPYGEKGAEMEKTENDTFTGLSICSIDP